MALYNLRSPRSTKHDCQEEFETPEGVKGLKAYGTFLN
jgi:hypothetical protein